MLTPLYSIEPCTYSAYWTNISPLVVTSRLVQYPLLTFDYKKYIIYHILSIAYASESLLVPGPIYCSPMSISSRRLFLSNLLRFLVPSSPFIS